MTILILSNTANVDYYNLLHNCIVSIGNYPVVVVETNSNLKGKKIPLQENRDCKFIFPEEDFNYNKFLNIGLKTIKDEKIIITNNDVEFLPGCVSEINSKLSVYDSISPFDFYNKNHTTLSRPIVEGYEIGNHVTGCCLGLTSNTLSIIGPFDESFKFWYQDNDYTNLLKKYNLKHALLRDAKIKHYGQQSHRLLGNNHYNMTHGLETIYKEKWFE